MSTSLYVASAGASARLRELEFAANNLANASTEGFRADTPTFREALGASLLDASGEPTTETAIYVFTGSSGPSTRQRPGAFVRTDAPLDAAVDGEGFFSLQTPGGVVYTRAGQFRVDRAGLLVNPDGHPVLGDTGPIAVGPRSARIQPDGQVVDGDGEAIGRLSVMRFEDPSQLRKRGQNMFEAPPLARRVPVDDASLIPGGLEGSNVQPMEELARLVALQRAFDASLQALEADDTASRTLFQEVMR